jgi:hypothetical protein
MELSRRTGSYRLGPGWFCWEFLELGDSPAGKPHRMIFVALVAEHRQKVRGNGQLQGEMQLQDLPDLLR